MRTDTYTMNATVIWFSIV